MMNIRVLAFVALLCLTGSANAFRVIEQPERPFEVALGQVTLPRDTGGSVGLGECDRCGTSTRRFVDGAKFIVDGRPVQYADFLEVVKDLRGSPTANDTTVVNVYVDKTTERVTRIAIRRPRH